MWNIPAQCMCVHSESNCMCRLKAAIATLIGHQVAGGSGWDFKVGGVHLHASSKRVVRTADFDTHP